MWSKPIKDTWTRHFTLIVPIGLVRGKDRSVTNTSELSCFIIELKSITIIVNTYRWKACSVLFPWLSSYKASTDNERTMKHGINLHKVLTQYFNIDNNSLFLECTTSIVTWWNPGIVSAPYSDMMTGLLCASWKPLRSYSSCCWMSSVWDTSVYQAIYRLIKMISTNCVCKQNIFYSKAYWHVHRIPWFWLMSIINVRCISWNQK